MEKMRSAGWLGKVMEVTVLPAASGILAWEIIWLPLSCALVCVLLYDVMTAMLSPKALGLALCQSGKPSVTVPLLPSL